MTAAYRQRKVEQVYIKSKCGHSILLDTNCLKPLITKQGLLKKDYFKIMILDLLFHVICSLHFMFGVARLKKYK